MKVSGHPISSRVDSRILNTESDRSELDACLSFRMYAVRRRFSKSDEVSATPRLRLTETNCRNRPSPDVAESIFAGKLTINEKQSDPVTPPDSADPTITYYTWKE